MIFHSVFFELNYAIFLKILDIKLDQGFVQIIFEGVIDDWRGHLFQSFIYILNNFEIGNDVDEFMGDNKPFKSEVDIFF